MASTAYAARGKLALRGHSVIRYERGVLLGETGSASSKLLHGGLRYLENREFRLVREALRERFWWLKAISVPRRANGRTEIDYLLMTYNTYFAEPRSPADVCETFAGLRPLIRSA